MRRVIIENIRSVDGVSSVENVEVDFNPTERTLDFSADVKTIYDSEPQQLAYRLT